MRTFRDVLMETEICGRLPVRTPAGIRLLTQEERERLLEWLKDNARDMAAELRDAGWEEDERGLWSKPGTEWWTNQFQGLHLFDAHELATRPDSRR